MSYQSLLWFLVTILPNLGMLKIRKNNLGDTGQPWIISNNKNSSVTSGWLFYSFQSFISRNEASFINGSINDLVGIISSWQHLLEFKESFFSGFRLGADSNNTKQRAKLKGMLLVTWAGWQLLVKNIDFCLFLFYRDLWWFYYFLFSKKYPKMVLLKILDNHMLLLCHFV